MGQSDNLEVQKTCKESLDLPEEAALVPQTYTLTLGTVGGGILKYTLHTSATEKEILDLFDGRMRQGRTVSLAEPKLGSKEDIRINARNLVYVSVKLAPMQY